MEVNAQLIKDKRSHLGWTQQQLADACGVSLRTIQRVERYGNASNETAMALASVYEVNQQELAIEPKNAAKTIVVTTAAPSKKYLLLSNLLTGLSCSALTAIITYILLT